ncbi:MAG: MYXO-CTERM domain-containing protein [Myxococcota bacterium]
MLIAPLLLVACAFEVALVDDLGASEELHQPWLTGAAPTLRGVPSKHRGGDELELDVVDDSVAELRKWSMEGRELVIDLRTLAPGSTELLIRKASSGRVLQRVPVEVVNPNDVRLVPAADVFQGKDPKVREPSVVVGGTASFLLQLTHDDVDVYGNVAPEDDTSTSDGGFGEVATRAGMSADLTGALAGIEGRWLELEAGEAGDHPVTLEPVKGVEIDVVVHAVMPAAVGQLRFAQADEESAEKGQNLQLSIRAFDFADEELYGAPVEWEVEGEVIEARSGQVIHYEYDPGKVQQAVVRLADLEVDTVFHGRIVDADYACGCATGSTGALWYALGLLGLVRRRR